MAVSKRVRYEVLRRDNHACRYCGGAAPDVVLTVDHVVPVALGGGDDPSNLVAACRDCNAGKTSTAPDGPLVADVEQDAMRWAAAIRQAAAERQADQKSRAAIEDWFLKIWKNWTYGGPSGDKYTVAIPGDFGQSIHQFLAAGLESHDLEELVGVAMRCKTTKDEWKYFCGCCWRRVRQAQERAAQIISANDEDDEEVEEEGRSEELYAQERYDAHINETGSASFDAVVDALMIILWMDDRSSDFISESSARAWHAAATRNNWDFLETLCEMRDYFAAGERELVLPGCVAGHFSQVESG